MNKTEEPSDSDNACAEHICISRIWRRGITGAILFQQITLDGRTIDKISHQKTKKGKIFRFIIKNKIIDIYGQEEACEVFGCAVATFRKRIADALRGGLDYIENKDGIRILL
jgi:hypothetical protein